MQNENEILWTAAFLNERFDKPVSPLAWSVVGALFEQIALREPLYYMGYREAATIPATRLWHGHPYANVKIFQIIYKPFPAALVPTDTARYFPDGDEAYRQSAPYPRSTWDPRLLWSLLTRLTLEAERASPLNYLAWKHFAAFHDTQIRALSRELAAAAKPSEILRVLDAIYALDAELLRLHRWSLTYADLFYRILEQWTGADAQLLISDTPNKTRMANDELAALARLSPGLASELSERIRGGAPLTAADKRTADALAAFLERHGHRAFSLDFAQPTFRDDPTQLLAFLQTNPAAERAHESFVSVRARAAKRLRGWQRPLYRPLVALARQYTQLREDQRDRWQKSLALSRRAFLELGRALVGREIIAEEADIFFATRAELGNFFANALETRDLAGQVAARKQEWRGFGERERARGPNRYPLFLRGDTPLTQAAAVEKKPNEWRGRGASGGMARGVARVIHEPPELFRVGIGEILIAPSTDPAWTPVFARAAGMALERGGVLSHGAVVAREYQLPAVVAVPNLTQAIQDGEWVEVDGTNGIVRRLT